MSWLVRSESAATIVPERTPAGADGASRAVAVPPGRTLRVLVVDDSSADAALVTAALSRDRSTCFTVDRATTIAASCDRVVELEPDCVLLDLGLPDAEGLEGLERLAAAAPDVPVVVVTGWDDTETALAAIAAGAQDYLVKGRMDVELIGRVIRYSVSRKRAEAELRRRERELRESEDRHRTLMEVLEEGVILEARDGAVLAANPSAGEILGVPVPALHGGTARVVCDDGTDWLHDERPWVAALRTGVGVTRCTVGIDRPDGTRVWLSLSSRPLQRPDEPVPHAVVTSFTDVTEQRAVERHLRELALHDALTGLPNRVQLVSRIDRALRRIDRDGDNVAVLYLDLDGFKSVNDTHGHGAGDELLCQVGRRLVATVRPTDTVARVGGDEFVVVCDHVAGAEEAAMVSSRILDAFLVPFPLATGDANLGISVGHAVSGPERRSAADLLREADQSMFESKRARS
jgi:diguanylate cyclase (GGDEF)-like protein/PAS domain S-box-containing protein